jgi:hypothetical protein
LVKDKFLVFTLNVALEKERGGEAERDSHAYLDSLKITYWKEYVVKIYILLMF